ncbi:MAG: RimK family alpha-L-glutamate ligase, partial [Nanoarchaeota archaeon]|nr:RimK family alpha-L-glutamate ligase [Nanoarchaeota archaeon]
PLGYYDFIYVKGSFRYANLLRSIAGMLEKKVPYMPLPGNVFSIAHNKLLTQLILQQHNIPMPKTYVSPNVESAKELLEKVNYPIVMKFPEGTQGKGVMFADSLASASSLLDALGVLNQPFIIQEYVETDGTDIRALVVGDKVIGAMRRIAQKEEKRANIHAGGKGEFILLDRETTKVAVDAAKALDADVLGVDILEGGLGPQVIEVNASPGLQGLNEVSTLDIPDELAKFFFRKTEEVIKGKKTEDAKSVMKQIALENGDTQEVVSTLQFRGEKIILPEFVSKLTRFNDRKEYSIKAKRGKLEIEEFKI